MATSLFGEEHDALRDIVRRWVERDGAEASRWEREGGWPREALGALAAQGWLGTALSPADGGDVLAGLVVWEELGRLRSGGMVADLLAQAHGAAVLVQAGAADVADEALGGGLAVTLLGGDLTMSGDEAHRTLSGSVPAVANAGWADLAVAVVPDADGLTLALVRTGAEGVRVTPPSDLFGRRGGHAADVELRDATADRVLVRGADGLALMRERQARWRLDHAAAAVAAAWLAWEDAKAYALQREAFGRPIGTFQVNRHALADMAAELTALRALVHETARRVLRGEAGPEEIAALRLRADRVATQVADRCLQLHGGYGYTMEFDVQRAWRDAAHLRVDEAGDAALREEIAVGLESRVRGDTA